MTDPADVQRAIETIESSRKTHVDWIEYLALEDIDPQELVPMVTVAGSAEHHAECVAGYDNVLRVLRGLVTS